jgi:hypothetical protein
MARNSIVAVAVAMAVAGCAQASPRRAELETQPSASIPALPSVAGHWRGVAWETGAHLIQGNAPIDIRLAPDGTWRGTIGKGSASGTARMHNGRLVLTGVTRMPDGRHDFVSYSLSGHSTRRWGESVAIFSGRPTHADVSLEKTAS